MGTYRLSTPISIDEVAKLRVGDTLYISGVVISARDAAHRRMLEIGPP
ncbi:MAG: fumarate hydratase C-terminal domain-containing protein, partial [Pyrobaculum sp.]